MKMRFVFDDETNELFNDGLEEELEEQSFYSRFQDDYSLEMDFYLPFDIDNRTWKSYVEDINGGDNFADYCEYIFKILEEEEYFDNW